MAPVSRLIFLTGAPNGSSLYWESHDFMTQLLPSFWRSEASTGVVVATSPTELQPAWRRIPMERQHLPTGFSQLGRIVPEQRGIPAPDDVATSFFSTSGPSFGSVEASIDDEARSSSSDKTDEEILSQFYEHSFAVHENIASSQIDVQEVSSQEGADLSVAITSTSCLTSTSSSYSFGSPASPVVDKNSIPISGRLSDLADIPNASYLHSISPQTMTVDLIVGIISIPAPRFIKTRRGGREMELVEMLVGDETKAGFAINFWLPPLHDAKGRPRAESNLKKELESSRPGDIVSTINVALSSFRGKVYGQSLRKDMTKLGLLYRSMDNLEDTANHNETIHSMDAHKKHPQVAKAKRVKEWVMQFVGSSNQADAVKIDAQCTQSTRMKGQEKHTLPPDTQ